VARKRRLFDRALKTSLNDADYQRLQDQYQELCGAVTDSLRTVD
jgi:hypothetical protein